VLTKFPKSVIDSDNNYTVQCQWEPIIAVPAALFVRPTVDEHHNGEKFILCALQNCTT
jgi:hypothetical protein